jgi:CBS domain-containing protein
MRISEIMTRTVKTIPHDATLVSAARMMRDEDIGLLPVVADGNVVGVISDRDLAIRGLAEDRDPRQVPVREVMSERVVSCRPEASADEVVRQMARHQVRRVVVVNDGKSPIGIVSIGDFATQNGGTAKAGKLLRDVSE